MTPPPVDWLRVAHRLLGFVRALRGDGTVLEDTESESVRASKVTSTIETMGRSVVGCTRAAGCECALCREAKAD
jgi:hypothetical protein